MPARHIQEVYLLFVRTQKARRPAGQPTQREPTSTLTINTPPARTDWPHTRRTDPKQPDPKYDQPRMERRAKQETATTDIFSHGRTCTHSLSINACLRGLPPCRVPRSDRSAINLVDWAAIYTPWTCPNRPESGLCGPQRRKHVGKEREDFPHALSNEDRRIAGW